MFIKEPSKIPREGESRWKLCQSLEGNSGSKNGVQPGWETTLGDGPGAAGILTYGGKQQGISNLIMEGECQGLIRCLLILLQANSDFNICFLMECHNKMARGLIQRLKQTFKKTSIFVLALNSFKLSALLRALTLFLFQYLYVHYRCTTHRNYVIIFNK